MSVLLLQAQNLNLNNVTPVKIFELMFQSPENSVSQDDAHLSGQYISKLSFLILVAYFVISPIVLFFLREPC